MKRRKRKVQILSIIMSMIIMLLSACGKTEEIAEVTTDNVSDIEVEAESEVPTIEDLGEEEGKEEETEPEEIEEIEEPLAVPYFDENKLEFCEDLTIPVKAVRVDINDRSVYEEVDAECVIKDISIEEMADGTRNITIKYEVTGELYDSLEKRLLEAIMPNAVYCDLNTGELQDFDGVLFDNEEAETFTVEWNGETYEIAQTKVVEWSPKPNWKSDGKNGYVTPVTMYTTDSFVIPKGYDSLGMVIGFSTAEEVYSGEYDTFDTSTLILDILNGREDARLYSINELCKLFSEDKVVEDNVNNSNTASSNNSNSTANTNNSSSKDSTTPKQEQPTHTHSYSSSVTKNPSCGENGVKTYTCSCGSSYTEAIPASGHQWTTTTETITHPSTGHYETVTKKEIWCSCGARGFQSMAEYNAHAENCLAFGCGVDEWTENVWIVDSESWTESISTTKCVVCGAQG